MLDFITQVSKKIGAPEDTARKATGAVLQFVQEHADPKDAKQLLDGLPGAAQLLKSTPESGDTGFVGQLASKVAAKTGGVGTTVGLAAALTSSGLAANQFGSFVTAFVHFVKSKAGDDLVRRILVKAPELQQLAG